MTTEPKPESPRAGELRQPTGAARHAVALLVLLAVVWAAYSNFFAAGFALDNKFIILEDPRLRAATKENVRLILTEDYWWPKAVSGLYRPLTTLSYLFNYSVMGNAERAPIYVLINLLLHYFNAVLVFYVVSALMKSFWPALLTAAVFGAHPIATESVINIVGRADLFATLAVLGGFLLYVRSAAAMGWRKLLWLAGLMTVTAVGVFCKESTVVVLGVIVLYDFTYRLRQEHPHRLVNLGKNFWRFFYQGYVALVPPFLALWFVRQQVFERLRPAEQPFVDNPLIAADFWTGRLTAIKVVGNYFKLLLWPRTLSCDYSYDQIPLVSWEFNRWEDWKALVALVVVIGVLWIAIRQYRRNPVAFFFVMLFFVTLLPTSNLLKTIGSIMAERFLYMPSIGFAGCVVIAVYAISRRVLEARRSPGQAPLISLDATATFLVGLAVVGLVTRTFLRNFDWRNDVTLWTSAARACPDSFKSHKSLAYALYEVDRDLKVSGDRIIAEAERAMAIMEKDQLPHILRTGIVPLHLGVYYRIRGDSVAQKTRDGRLVATEESKSWYEKSAEALRRAVPIDQAFNELNRRKELRRGKKPDDIATVGNPEIYSNLAIAYLRLEQYQNALDAYAYMRKLMPAGTEAYIGMATVYLAGGHAEAAVVSLMQALLIDSNRTDALELIIQIYREANQQDCAVDASQDEPKLKLDCPLVRSHICTACYGLVSAFLEGKLTDPARQLKENALKHYGCPVEPFDELLPEPPTTARSSP